MSALKNGSSRQLTVRVPLAIADWLEARATTNPANKYRQIATEMNAILKDAFEADPKNSK